MEIFLNLWNNWTHLEKIYTFSLFLSLFILIPLLVFLITKNKKFLIFTICSLLSSALLILIGITLLNLLFNYTVTYIFLLTPTILLFTTLLNIGTCIGYYKLHGEKKSFTLIDLRKEYMEDSIYLTIFILLLFSALSIFLTSTFLIFILLSATVSIATVWINYVLLYYIVK